MTLGDIVARRRKCAMTTRGEMLCAARQRFLDESYENVGLRDIARDVGVDVALVSRYFGSKEELFREVLHGDAARTSSTSQPDARRTPRLFRLPAVREGRVRGSRACREIAHHAALRFLAGRRRDRPHAIRSDVLDPLARLLEGPLAAERARLALAILLGTTVLRTVMAVEPGCEES